MPEGGTVNSNKDFLFIRKLYCSQNPKLSQLILGNKPVLKQLTCHGNKISSLDISGCSALTKLICSNNQIASLDVSGLPDLKILNCSNNNISKLNVKKNRYYSQLRCS